MRTLRIITAIHGTNVHKGEQMREEFKNVMLSGYIMLVHVLAMFGAVGIYFAIKDPIQLCQFAVKGIGYYWR